MNRVGLTVAQEDCCCNVAITLTDPDRPILNECTLSNYRLSNNVDVKQPSLSQIRLRPETEFWELIETEGRARLTEP